MSVSHQERSEIRRRAEADIRRGTPVAVLVRRYNRSPGWVRLLVVSVRGRTRRAPASMEALFRVVSLRRSGMTYASIARLVGLSKTQCQRIYEAAEAAGVWGPTQGDGQ